MSGEGIKAGIRCAQPGAGYEQGLAAEAEAPRDLERLR
jgi:hypothetical protein